MEIKCLKCGDTITSIRRQLIWCKCGSTGIDDLDYNLVRIIGDDWERVNKFDMTLVLPEIKNIEIHTKGVERNMEEKQNKKKDTSIYLQVIDEIDELERDCEDLLREFEKRTGLKIQSIQIFGSSCSGDISSIKITIGIK